MLAEEILSPQCVKQDCRIAGLPRIHRFELIGILSVDEAL